MLDIFETDVKEVLTATPSSREYPGRVMLESVDPDAPMPIVSKGETSRGVMVVWRVTFRRGFEIQGFTVEPGTTYDFDATLKRSGDQWLIDNF